MLATTLLALALVSSALALPSEKRACDISKATIAFPPGQTALAAPTSKPSYVSIGLGTQNYTCGSTGTYTNNVAVAEIFDISCLYNSPSFSSIADNVYTFWKDLPPSITPQKFINALHDTNAPTVLGQHYYVTNPITGQGVNPKWDFTSQGMTKGNAKAFVVAAKVAALAAPTGTQDIAWVQLKSISGSLATEVYRVDTRGGQPPPTCTTPGQEITVKYVAKYWLFGSSL